MEELLKEMLMIFYMGRRKCYVGEKRCIDVEIDMIVRDLSGFFIECFDIKINMVNLKYLFGFLIL